MAYLIGKGHEKLALVTPDISSEGVIRERYRGFSDACREAGVPFKKGNIYYSESTYNSGVSIGQDIAFKNTDYTAVACMSDIVAFGVIEGLKQCGIRVPYDISVIGFDTIEEAIEIANSSKFGLSGAIITNDMNKALKTSEAFESGGFVINGASFFRSFEQPFGGWKYSGIGNEGIMTTLDEMSRMKTIILKNMMK